MRKKSLLGLATVICFAFCLIFTAPLSAKAAESNELPVCDGTHTDYTAIDNAFLVSAGKPQITLDSGKFFLAENVKTDILVTGEVTLCLNGNILKGMGTEFNRSVVTVDTKGTGGLRLCDCKETKHLYSKIEDKYVLDDSLNTSAASTLSFTGGAITGGNATDKMGGGGISVRENSDLIISGCNIIANNALETGGGISINSTKAIGTKEIKLVGTKIIGNTSAKNGGGIYSGYAKLNLENAKVYYNSALSDGGGVYLNNKDVKAEENANGEFTTILKDSEIHENSAKVANGGGIAQIGAKVDMTGGRIAGNNASVGGGGVVVHGAGIFSLNSGDITRNSAGAYGGGFQMWGGVLEVKGGKISTNKSAEFGGGVSLYYNGALLKVSGGEISENMAQSGGGVYLHQAESKLEMTGGKINKNAADSNGGGIYMEQGEALLMGGEIKENNASFSGGGICAFGALKIGGTVEIIENTLGGAVKNNVLLALSKLINQKITFVEKFSGKLGLNVPDDFNGALVTSGYGSTGSDGQVFYDNDIIDLENVGGEFKVKNDTVTITFEDSDIDSVKVKKGELITQPVSPVRKGYNFIEWTLNGTKFDFVTMTVNVDTTLTAKWELVNYKITYITNGGETIAEGTYTFMSDNIILVTPTKAGFIFSGWYNNGDFTGTGITEIAKGSIGDVTLYAKWEVDPDAKVEPKNNVGMVLGIIGVVVGSVAIIGAALYFIFIKKKKNSKP